MEDIVNNTVCNATGRRKESIARVRLMPGKGEIFINGRDVEEYFSRESQKILIRQPFLITNTVGKYKCLARVNGGGLTGQTGALRLGISRALIKANETFGSLLKKKGLLTRDPRMKERKKFGLKGARKRFQWTKR